MNNEIDSLLELYKKHMPEKVYLVKNKEKYQAIENAIKELTRIAKKYDEECNIKVHADELIGSIMCLEIETSLLALENLDELCNSLKLADTLEICPLLNGSVSISMTFQDAWLPFVPRK